MLCRNLLFRLSGSQKQLTAHYRLNLDAVRNLEQHRNESDPVARNLLETIARDPVGVERILWSE